METAQSPPFFAICGQKVIKSRQFLNASRIYNYQGKIATLCEMIALSLIVSKI